MPAESVTDQVTLPVPVTSVDSFTPGPERWKLWIVDESLTSKSYGPAATSPVGPLMQHPTVAPDTEPLSVSATAPGTIRSAAAATPAAAVMSRRPLRISRSLP